MAVSWKHVSNSLVILDIDWSSKLTSGLFWRRKMEQTISALVKFLSSGLPTLWYVPLSLAVLWCWFWFISYLGFLISSSEFNISTSSLFLAFSIHLTISLRPWFLYSAISIFANSSLRKSHFNSFFLLFCHISVSDYTCLPMLCSPPLTFPLIHPSSKCKS